MQTETKIITRYSETDQMGIIHHSIYAVWFEAGRTDFFKKIGISYKEKIIPDVYSLLKQKTTI